MAISASMVKELREKTGAGMMDCKKALTNTDGDMDKAVEWLRENGLAKAEKKAGQEAQTSRPALFNPFRVWVTVWVNQLTHILTHTEKSKIATKKPQKPKFSRLFGAARQIRTADLILTN